MKKIETLEDYYKVIEGVPKVIIYWYTKWCPDCFAIKPYIPRLEEDFKEFEFYSMDRDLDIELAKHLNIFGIPSFLVYDGGIEIGRFVDKNRKTYDQVKDFILTITK